MSIVALYILLWVVFGMGVVGIGYFSPALAAALGAVGFYGMIRLGIQIRDAPAQVEKLVAKLMLRD